MIGRAAASLDSGRMFSSSVLTADSLRAGTDADCGNSGVGCVGTADVPFCTLAIGSTAGVVFGTTAETRFFAASATDAAAA